MQDVLAALLPTLGFRDGDRSFHVHLKRIQHDVLLINMQLIKETIDFTAKDGWRNTHKGKARYQAPTYVLLEPSGICQTACPDKSRWKT